MALDGIAVAAITAELSDALTGGRIDKIHQPRADEVILSVRREKARPKALLSANPGNPRAHLTDSLPRKRTKRTFPRKRKRPPKKRKRPLVKRVTRRQARARIPPRKRLMSLLSVNRVTRHSTLQFRRLRAALR